MAERTGKEGDVRAKGGVREPGRRAESVQC
jgi:hypothetical protein